MKKLFKKMFQSVDDSIYEKTIDAVQEMRSKEDDELKIEFIFIVPMRDDEFSKGGKSPSRRYSKI